MAQFASLGVDDAVCRALGEALPAIIDPTDVQRAAIPLIGQMLGAGGSTDASDASKLAHAVGKDTVLVRAQTGSGKTLAFLLPILSRMLIDARSAPHDRPVPAKKREETGTVAIVVVPTRELAAQTERMLSAILGRLRGRDHWPVSCALVGTSHRASGEASTRDDDTFAAASKQRKHEKERLRRGVHVVVGTPGRLLDHIGRTEGWARRAAQSVRCVVLDEADRLLDSGFRKPVCEILAAFSHPAVVRVLCSATLSPSAALSVCAPLSERPQRKPVAQGATEAHAQNSNAATVEGTAETERSGADTKGGDMQTPGTLKQEYVVPPTRARLAALIGLVAEIIAAGPGARVVVFGICCDVVDTLYAVLRLCTRVSGTGGSYDPFARLLPRDTAVVRLHGGMPQAERAASLASYVGALSADEPQSNMHASVLVATDVAARGLNLASVDVIVQYNAPCDLADYVHRAGRSARAGAAGRSVLFLMPSERPYAARLSAAMVGGTRVHRLRWEPLVDRVASTVPERLLSDDSPVSSGAHASAKSGAHASGKSGAQAASKSGAVATKQSQSADKNGEPADAKEDDGLAEAPLNMRRRLHAWQSAAESLAIRTLLDASLHASTTQQRSTAVAKTQGSSAKGNGAKAPKRAQADDAQCAEEGPAALRDLGEKAFLAFVRAYATHPAAEKDVFHIRRLHLGHLAATFLLAEPPRRVANRYRTGGAAEASFSRGRRVVRDSAPRGSVVLDKRVADELGLRTDGTKRRR